MYTPYSADPVVSAPQDNSFLRMRCKAVRRKAKAVEKSSSLRAMSLQYAQLCEQVVSKKLGDSHHQFLKLKDKRQSIL